MFQEISVPDIPWHEWQSLAIRELKMRPEDFWSLPFQTAIKIMCRSDEEQAKITRKEILEGERNFYMRMNP